MRSIYYSSLPYKKVAIKIYVIIICIFMLSLLPSGVMAQLDQDDPERQLDLHFLDEYWNEIAREVDEFFPQLNWRDALNWVKPGEGGLDAGGIIQGLIRYLLREVVLNFSFMGKLLVLAVVAAFLKNLQSSFESQNVAWLTQIVVLMVLIGLVLPGFIAAVDMAYATINLMVDFILSLIPILLVLLASLGSFSSATIFQPIVIFSVHFFSTVIRNVVFPLIFFYTVLALVDTFSTHLKLKKVADFFKDLSVWTLGILMTVFVTLVSLKAVAGTVGDAVAMKTAKYLSGAFIPVIGKIMGDAVETVAGASLLFKNGVGLAGLLTLILISVFPLIKLAALVLIYRITAALVQLFGETPLGDCLTVMANSLMLILASVTSVTLIFFIAVVVIIGSGNALLMLR